MVFHAAAPAQLVAADPNRKTKAMISKPVPGGETRTLCRKGEQTRSKFKAAARRALARKRPADLQLTDVCRAAGVTVGAFYRHFPSKDAVVEEIAADVLDEIFAKFKNIESLDLFRELARQYPRNPLWTLLSADLQAQDGHSLSR